MNNTETPTVTLYACAHIFWGGARGEWIGCSESAPEGVYYCEKHLAERAAYDTDEE